MRDNYIVTVNWRVDSLEGEGGGGAWGRRVDSMFCHAA